MVQIFKLSGLTCQACKKIIEKRVNTLPDIINVAVDLESRSLSIESSKDIQLLKIKAVLADTQYKVTK